jgi:hypothetical protein
MMVTGAFSGPMDGSSSVEMSTRRTSFVSAATDGGLLPQSRYPPPNPRKNAIGMNIYTRGEIGERLECNGFLSMAALYCFLEESGDPIGFFSQYPYCFLEESGDLVEFSSQYPHCMGNRHRCGSLPGFRTDFIQTPLQNITCHPKIGFYLTRNRSF